MEEQQVINTIVNIFNGSDRHDWRMVRDCFMFEVFLDYFSLNKKPGEKIKADEIVKGWSDFLPAFSFTHHVLTNFEVEVSAGLADAFCKGSALHYMPDITAGNTWTTIGTYKFKLTKSGNLWKVNSMTFNLLYEEGNKGLPGLAVKEE